MEGETKTPRIDQKSTFFYFFVFFSKNLVRKFLLGNQKHRFLKSDHIKFYWIKT